MSTIKIHHTTMKLTAAEDYSVVKEYCINNELPIFLPKGTSWPKIEDATASMLKGISEFTPYLNRGLSYYKSL